MAKKNNDDKELRRVTEEEVKKILDANELWNKTNGQRGKLGDLSYLDMKELILDDFKFYGISIKGSDFRHAKLRDCSFQFVEILNTNFSYANMHRAKFEVSLFDNVNFSYSNLNEAIFEAVDLETTNFLNATLFETTINVSSLDELINLTDEQKRWLKNVSSNSEEEKNIEDQASYEIVKLKRELEKREKQLKETRESEKQKINLATKFIEEKLLKTEAVLEKERKAKKNTKEDIVEAIKHLRAPNNYVQSQITIQYVLTFLYLTLVIISVWFLCYYISDHYSVFKDELTEKTTFLQWLFYALPIAISFSLIITFINQINARLKTVVNLNEKKRYVDSISGGLKAVQELSENNKEARARISSVLDEILHNTITLSEKLQEDTLPEESPIDNKVSVSLKDLKDLFSK